MVSQSNIFMSGLGHFYVVAFLNLPLVQCTSTGTSQSVYFQKKTVHAGSLREERSGLNLRELLQARTVSKAEFYQIQLSLPWHCSSERGCTYWNSPLSQNHRIVLSKPECIRAHSVIKQFRIILQHNINYFSFDETLYHHIC